MSGFPSSRKLRTMHFFRSVETAKSGGIDVGIDNRGTIKD